MKNTIKVFGFIALVAVIGFSMAACGGDDNDDGDTTAPILSLQAVAEYQGTANGTTATVLFTSNEAGTYYVLVALEATFPAGTAPTASVVAASSITGTVEANTETVSITNLLTNIPYKAYVTVKDAAGNFSAVWPSDAFTPSSTNIPNPFPGTWIQDNPSGTNDEIKVVCDATTWEAYVTDSSQGVNNVLLASGPYTYNGMPALWEVTYTIGQPYTALKVGDKGTATTVSSGAKIQVSTFADEGANGTYTKQP